MSLKITPLVLLTIFYLSYIVKLLILRQQNIQADVLGKGEKPKGRAAFEIALKCVTYFGVVVQFASVIYEDKIWRLPAFPTMWEDGLILMALGVAAFILAITAMKSNWRAGYSEGQNTDLVTTGIYKYSRNPAFVGFDLLYIGCSLAFPNLFNIAAMVIAMVFFHMQILGEEEFLTDMFGKAYTDYKAKTMRYLGRRR